MRRERLSHRFSLSRRDRNLYDINDHSFNQERFRDREKDRIKTLSCIKKDHELLNILNLNNEDQELLKQVFDDTAISSSSAELKRWYGSIDSVYFRSLFNDRLDEDIAKEELNRNVELLRNGGVLFYNIKSDNLRWQQELSLIESHERLQEIDEYKMNPHFAVFQIQREE